MERVERNEVYRNSSYRCWKCKKVNQDSLTLKTAHSRWGDVCIAVICDGLGGLAQGEVASGNVVLAFDKWFNNEFLHSVEDWTKESIQNAWEELIVSMNEKIQAYGEQQGVELGTTLTVALFLTGNTRYLVKLDRAG